MTATRRTKGVRVQEETEHEGKKKTAAQVLDALTARGVRPELERTCLRYYCAPLEVCGASRSVPVYEARAALWTFLKTAPPEGAGWSAPRIAEVFDCDHTTVLSTIKVHVAKAKRAAARVPDLGEKKP